MKPRTISRLFLMTATMSGKVTGLFFRPDTTNCLWQKSAPSRSRLGNVLILQSRAEAIGQFGLLRRATKPCLHPLRSASGKIVTRHFPMAWIGRESTDHPHADMNGFNFRASDPLQQNAKSGVIRLKRIVKLAGGARSGSADVVFDWVDPRRKAISSESCAMVLRAGAAKQAPVPKRMGLMIGSAPCHAEKGCRGKRADWMDYAAEVSRRYGLFAANPFHGHYVSNGQSDGGGIAMEPGGTLRFRYRVPIHSGRTDAARLTQAYTDYVKGGR